MSKRTHNSNQMKSQKKAFWVLILIILFNLNVYAASFVLVNHSTSYELDYIYVTTPWFSNQTGEIQVAPSEYKNYGIQLVWRYCPPFGCTIILSGMYHGHLYQDIGEINTGIFGPPGSYECYGKAPGKMTCNQN